MIDLDRELRATLEERVRLAPPPVGARRAIRAARRRQVGVVVTALALVAAVAVGSVTGVSALVRSSEDRVPIGPARTPTPSPSAPVPAVVSGSGLQGYVRTSFPVVRGVGLEDLAVAPDGTLWAAFYQWSKENAGKWSSPTGPVVARLDDETWTPYTALPLPDAVIRTVEVAPDGTVWAVGGGLARLEGESWATAGPPWATRVAFAPDGSVVAGGEGRVSRLDGEAWTTLADPGTLPGDVVTALDVAPDGIVWVGTYGAFGTSASILRFDGRAWTTWDVDELVGWRDADILAGDAEVSALTVAPDGSVWAMVRVWQENPLGWDFVTECTLARFDGAAWSEFLLPGDCPEGTAVGPDGRIWIASGRTMLSFDGSSWTSNRLPGLGIASALEIGPDGTLWVGFDSSLVRLTPPE